MNVNSANINIDEGGTVVTNVTTLSVLTFLQPCTHDKVSQILWLLLIRRG